MDIYDKLKRSEIMSKISGQETKPEIIVRKYLHAYGFRFRKNYKRYPGKPDIILPKHKTAIFVNGCFWHGHNCKAAALPKTRTQFWKDKIDATSKRDQRNYSDLCNLGWKVLIVWECELSNLKLTEERLSRLISEIIM